ncbi:NUDIX domain-containing protein [Mucilaginibacter aquaedulcis]|uniref:NUDIX domain-containing protein n=1 Tax=Mucilaginibacter aquaedulcis TaxID=1187081 RepID=UPI0025B5FEEF|nr:NUDIX domain-containing protein [Mucilaginibacter aquaedulcis]MDN3548536.1 NUDIX domain-containing protein [Mucilaginibacter aquaedulcis]
MGKQSAGILLFRKTTGVLQVFLVHPGGPFFKNKDDGSWSVPKGEFLEDEDPLNAAKREFEEETGQAINGEFIPLTPIKQKGGKTVQAWAVAGDIDHLNIKSNSFDIEWPPRSGRQQSFPEIDRANWFDMETAKVKINPAQAALLAELVELGI